MTDSSLDDLLVRRKGFHWQFMFLMNPCPQAYRGKEIYSQE